MQPAIIIVIALVVIAAIAAIAIWFWTQRNRSEHLRERFGPEYERVVDRVGDRKQAENVLASHEKRVEKLQIRELGEAERDRYSTAWSSAQAQFVDDPGGAIRQADTLVIEVMQARGYPMGDFERRAADVSVDHPRTVSDYRTAHEIAQRQQRGEASTEDLRSAMLCYRSLFDDLLQKASVPSARRDRKVEAKQ
jgi:hypothetical protein